MALTKISSNLVADDAIVTGKIADGGVATADLAANAVTTAKIAQNNVTAHHIADGSVTTTQLGADSVTNAKIADDAISEEHLDKTIISDLTEVAVATGDFVLLGDTSDSNNLKKAPISSILAGTLTTAAQTNITSLGTLTGLTGGTGDLVWDSTTFVVDSSANKVGIGTASPAQTLSVDASGGANLFVSRTGQTGGLYIESDGTNGVIRNPASNPILFQTNGANTRMQISSIGKTSWSANGVGNVATQDRDFTFYTEGSTNGVAINSAANRIVFMGGAGSSGTGSDKGYLQLEAEGTAKVAFNSDGSSFITGGKLGIGESDPNEPLTVRSPNENINCTLLEIGNDLHATNTKDAWMKFVCGAAQNDNSWAIGAYPGSFRFSYLGTRGTAVTTSGAEKMRLTSNGGLNLGTTSGASAGGIQTYVGDNDEAIDCEGPARVNFTINSDESGGNRWYFRTAGSGNFGSGNGDLLVLKEDGTQIMKWDLSSMTIVGNFDDTSDVALKENITDLIDATAKIKALQPRTFDWKDKNKTQGTNGFIAQEVETVLPKLVHGDNYDPENPHHGHKAINTSGLLAVAIKAIQELEARIKTLEG